MVSFQPPLEFHRGRDLSFICIKFIEHVVSVRLSWTFIPDRSEDQWSVCKTVAHLFGGLSFHHATMPPLERR